LILFSNARSAILKGTCLTLHLQRRARQVSKTSAHAHARPGETTAHNRDASVPAGCGLAEPARGHDGAVTSVMSAEMPAPLLCLRHRYGHNRPGKTSEAVTATITNKSPWASLQLTPELGGYIRRMRSRAPTKNSNNTTNTKIHQLSLSATS
jgi:hypothetical protein